MGDIHGDVSLHRVRFVDAPSSGAVCVAAHPSGGFLALARQGGDVELWRCDRPAESWNVVAVVPGSARAGVQALAWVPVDASGRSGGRVAAPASSTGEADDADVDAADMSGTSAAASGMLGWHGARLFIAHLSGAVSEVNWHAKVAARWADAHAGAIWSMASFAVPASTSLSASSPASGVLGTLLAVGCEDGSVRVFGVPASPDAPDDGAAPICVCPGTDGRVLSLAWHPSAPVLFAGTSTGSIRGWDMSGVARTLEHEDSDGEHEHETAKLTRAQSAAAVASATSAAVARVGVPLPVVRMQLESYGRADTLVWCLCVASDMTVVAGDSLGHVTVWDGRSGTLAVSTPLTRHDADVLSLAVSESVPEGYSRASPMITVASSGVDGRVSVSRRVRARQGKSAAEARRWVLLGSHRAHSHDVRSVLLLGYHGGAHGSMLPLQASRLQAHPERMLVVSASADTQLAVVRTADIGTQVPKRFTALASRHVPIAVAARAGLLASYTSTSVELWRILRGHDVDVAAAAAAERPHRKRARPVDGGSVSATPASGKHPACAHTHLLSIALPCRTRDAKATDAAVPTENPVAIALSSDGAWLAYSTAGCRLHIVALSVTDSGALLPMYVTPPTLPVSVGDVPAVVTHLTFLPSADHNPADSPAATLVAVTGDQLHILSCAAASVTASAGSKRAAGGADRGSRSASLMYSLPIPNGATSTAVFASTVSAITTPGSSSSSLKHGAVSVRGAAAHDGAEFALQSTAAPSHNRRARRLAARQLIRAPVAVSHLSASHVLPPDMPPAERSKLVSGFLAKAAGAPAWLAGMLGSASSGASYLLVSGLGTDAFTHLYVLSRNRGGLWRTLPRLASGVTAATTLMLSGTSEDVTGPVVLVATRSGAVAAVSAATGMTMPVAAPRPRVDTARGGSRNRRGRAAAAKRATSPEDTTSGLRVVAADDSGANAHAPALPRGETVRFLCPLSTGPTPAIAAFGTHHVGIMSLKCITPGVTASGAAADGPAPAGLTLRLSVASRRFAHIMHAAALYDDAPSGTDARGQFQAVAVEMPWERYIGTAPAALERKVYGT